MARTDPSLLGLYELIKTDESLNTFLQQYRLVSKPVVLGFTRNQKPFIGYCSASPFNPLKPQCTGLIVEAMRNGLPKFRCTVCRSEKSAHHGPAAYDPNAAQRHMSFFNNVDSDLRPNRKVLILFI